MPLKKIITALFSSFGYKLAGHGYDIIDHSLAEEANSFSYALKLYNHLPIEKQRLIAAYLPYSKSQIAQDLFVLSELGNLDHENFFVEFGATDGVGLSNTFLFEKQLGWNGILAEPAKFWHKSLNANRNCIIDERCVAAIGGIKTSFVEVSKGSSGGTPELSGLLDHADNGDWASEIRLSSSNVYDVDTVSLNQLLADYNAPRLMSYLSIDTEGSELSILQNLDFSRYLFRIITVEHSYRKGYRHAIRGLLEANGYKRIYERFSYWDDWYVLEDVCPTLVA